MIILDPRRIRSLYLSPPPPVRLSVSPLLCLSVCLSVCLSLPLSLSLSLSLSLAVCLSVYLSLPLIQQKWRGSHQSIGLHGFLPPNINREREGYREKDKRREIKARCLRILRFRYQWKTGRKTKRKGGLVARIRRNFLLASARSAWRTDFSFSDHLGRRQTILWPNSLPSLAASCFLSVPFFVATPEMSPMLAPSPVLLLSLSLCLSPPILNPLSLRIYLSPLSASCSLHPLSLALHTYIYIYIYIYTHTHTHTHIYICLSIYLSLALSSDLYILSL